MLTGAPFGVIEIGVSLQLGLEWHPKILYRIELTGTLVNSYNTRLDHMGSAYVTFRLNFHHFDHFELDLRGHIHVRGAAFSCLRLKWADVVLI